MIGDLLKMKNEPRKIFKITSDISLNHEIVINNRFDSINTL